MKAKNKLIESYSVALTLKQLRLV